MIRQLQEVVADRAKAVNGQLTHFGHETLRSARRAATDSAESLKALKTPLRTVVRGGVRISAVSQSVIQELIELQSETLTAAINEFAHRLERAARAETVVDLLRDQVELIPATRARIAADAGRVVDILASAGRELKDVAAQTYDRATDKTRKATAVPRQRPRKKTERRARARPRRAAA